jgi:hypothetical protein
MRRPSGPSFARRTTNITPCDRSRRHNQIDAPIRPMPRKTARRPEAADTERVLMARTGELIDTVALVPADRALLAAERSPNRSRAHWTRSTSLRRPACPRSKVSSRTTNARKPSHGWPGCGRSRRAPGDPLVPRQRLNEPVPCEQRASYPRGSSRPPRSLVNSNLLGTGE